MLALSCCAILLAATQAALPPSLRYPIPVATNQIESAQFKCDAASVNATITLQHPFKGLLFAKDFSHECNAIGTLSDSVSISLPTSGCGVRLFARNGVMVYSVVLVIQQDRHLKQISDQEKYFECQVDEAAFKINALYNQRKARNFGIDDALQVARAWMEIVPSSESNRLKVGESAVMKIKTTLPPGIGWKVVECVAQDGLGDSSQKLLDDEGCPIDENILPVPDFGPVLPVAMMKHQEAVAKFDAFKFPDRDRLHLSCRLELCRGNCQMIDCWNRTTDRLGRTLSKGEQGEILDKLEVFNSVEVLAPTIDEFDMGDMRPRDPISHPFKHLPGDRSFCVSPDKIAITFCVLGIIFLCAVLVAACALLKSRRNDSHGPFYTRSLFSSSSGDGSAFGSKLLLHDSPCQSASSRATTMPISYGRIL